MEHVIGENATQAPTAAAPWAALREHTAARIGIGRAGGSQRTASLLDFRFAQAAARDAVREPLDADTLAASLAGLGLASERLATAARDKREFLLRPDLGRQLDAPSRERLARLRDAAGVDLAIVVSDGHSARAVTRHAPALLAALVPPLKADGWRVAPVFIAPLGRVKLQDEVGVLLNARLTLMLLGERPGLSAPDSLGAYFTHAPTPASTDADRNCVSNIRPEGIPPERAAQKLAWLLREAARLGTSGVALKDTVPVASVPGGGNAPALASVA
ncbi:MAG: ethanolamine ammonia-lyase subunit EutC [Opitutaceae bacterium]|jgi:ethanolamine ammonia-lyase small subunit|nr:ethanolamine ammonia-lyase subunit EutC [Opitutaceae bacterium]